MTVVPSPPPRPADDGASLARVGARRRWPRRGEQVNGGAAVAVAAVTADGGSTTARRGRGGAGDVPKAPPIDDPTPIAVSSRTRAILIGLTIFAMAWVVWVAPIVPRLLVTGSALALVLSFPVRFLTRVMPRALAILLVVVALIVLVLVVLLVLIPTVIVQLTDLVAALPTYAGDAEELLRRALEEMQTRGWLTRDQQPDELVADVRAQVFARGQGAVEEVVAGVLTALTGAVGLLIQLFGVLFVAIYLLADIGRFKRTLLSATPFRYRDDVATLWRRLEESLSRYLGGLLVSIAVQSTAVTLALWMLDVDFALLLGLWMAATAVLPYVGAFLGAIPAVLVALFVSPLTAVAVAGVYLVVNQVEGNLLTPRIQGEAVRVHPLLIFLGVLAGSEVGGLLGAALAVPAMAIARVLLDFFQERLYVPQRAATAVGPGGAMMLRAGPIGVPRGPRGRSTLPRRRPRMRRPRLPTRPSAVP